MPKTDSPWVGVAIPREVADRIDQRLKTDGTYRSRSEYAKAAVLRMLGSEHGKGAA